MISTSAVAFGASFPTQFTTSTTPARCRSKDRRVVQWLMAVWLLLSAAPLASQERRIAVTIDDLPAVSVADTAEVTFITTMLLEALEAHGVTAVGFVNAGKLGDDPPLRGIRIDVLRRWLAADHALGNHTAFHLSPNDVPLTASLADITVGDSVPRALSAEVGRSYRWFRQPYLHGGTTDSVRTSIDSVLSALKLRTSPVTIDPKDWLFAAAWRNAAATGNASGTKGVETAFLDYAEAVLAYHERLAKTVTGGAIPHVLLLHANPMTAVVLDRLLARIHKRRYAFVPLDEAMQDPVYARPDQYRGAVGLAWLQRQAMYQRDVRIDDNPLPPAWIEALAGVSDATVHPY